MAVKIRLRRVGAKKQPSYRLVVADSRSPRDGRFIEIVGFYNPRTKPTTITIDEEKVRKWLGHGAQPTESVASLLYRAGIADLRSPRYRQGGANDGTQNAATAAETAPAQASAPAATVTAPAVEAAPQASAPAEPEAPAVEAAAPEAPSVEAAPELASVEAVAEVAPEPEAEAENAGTAESVAGEAEATETEESAATDEANATTES